MTKKTSKLKKFWLWIWYSSEHPQDVSLTIKGIFMTLAPVILIVANHLNLTLDMDQLESMSATMVLISTVGLTTVGLIRKLVNTYK
jgi:hypothetical protein